MWPEAGSLNAARPERHMRAYIVNCSLCVCDVMSRYCTARVRVLKETACVEGGGEKATNKTVGRHI